MKNKFPFHKQANAMDCGPTCLKMIAQYHGKNYPVQFFRDHAKLSRNGVSFSGLSEAAEKIGLRSLSVKVPFDTLVDDVPLPCIVHWHRRHFIALHEIQKAGNFKRDGGYEFHVADPEEGLKVLSENEFKSGWGARSEGETLEGVALLFETTPEFFGKTPTDEKSAGSTINIPFLLNYLKKYSSLVWQILLGLIIASILQLIFPFLTRSIVDTGINTANYQFIYLVLAAQVMLFLGRTAIEFIRSWIVLHISSRLNVSLLSNFLIKLMKLPISFFDNKMFGDIIQRIGDQNRVENFLTNQSISILFSILNLIVFGGVLAFYNVGIFEIFTISSLMYFGWIFIFFKIRRKVDYERFGVSASNQSTLVQLIHGMQEVKLANAERLMRWKWESLQSRLFNLNIKSLTISQCEQAGASFINEGKNIIITFLSATSVIEGNMTLGEMLAVQYIIGQLNNPIQQFVMFAQSFQDAKISIDRLNEIHGMDDEEKRLPQGYAHAVDTGFSLRNVSFGYPGSIAPILKNINLEISPGKMTAIVGTSGSGKTTLLKLLLKFYKPTTGSIYMGDTNLENIGHSYLRSKTGVVMQDGYIFSETIATNVALGYEEIDLPRLKAAAHGANVKEFIESLPQGYETKIGFEGNGISQGQKQRLLIARVIYKNPEIIFLDEATNALDANNEAVIISNLTEFFKGKTVVVVAHRLSTVRNADKIVVLEKGGISEEGKHAELTALKGRYYELVRNQLELGN